MRGNDYWSRTPYTGNYQSRCRINQDHFQICKVVHARSVISNPLWPHGFLCPWNFPGKNGEGCHFFLQIFLTQGLNPCLQHWQGGSLPAEPPGESTHARWVVFSKMVTIFCSFSIKGQHLFLHHLNRGLDMWLACIMGQEQTLHSQRLRKGLYARSCPLMSLRTQRPPWRSHGWSPRMRDHMNGVRPQPSQSSQLKTQIWEWDHLELSSPSWARRPKELNQLTPQHWTNKQLLF